MCQPTCPAARPPHVRRARRRAPRRPAPQPPDAWPRILLFGLGLLVSGCAFARAPAMTDPTTPIGQTTLRYADGPVTGLRVANGISAFRGLPYRGQPQRFERAGPPTPWTAARDARAPGPACPQVRQAPFTVQSEDCLSLDVWTPDPAGARPIIVFLHAGGWTHGGTRDPRLNGARLARQSDAVVITVNHRLGALGWSRIDHRGGSADAVNLGLLDLTDALFWVRRHGASFGGDPGNVTIAGASAGAEAVVALMTFPPARGAFHRAMAMSGAGSRLRFPNHAARVTDALMAAAGVRDVAGLRRLPIERLIAAQQTLTEGALLGDGFFGPAVIDRLNRLPHSAMAEGRAKAVPLLLGTTRHEARALLIEVPLASWLTPSRLFEALPGLFSALGRPTKAIAQVYDRALPGASANEQALAMVTDALFRMPAIRLAETRSEAGGRTFVYRFDWHPRRQDEPVGAMHGVDVVALFGSRWPGIAERVPDAVTGPLWHAVGRFVRHGAPDEDWPVYARARRAVRLFDRAPRTVIDPEKGRRRLWTALPFDGTAPVMIPAAPRS